MEPKKQMMAAISGGVALRVYIFRSMQNAEARKMAGQAAPAPPPASTGPSDFDTGFAKG